MQFDIRGEELKLLPQKAVWWKKKKMLMLADLHLGKINHFRRSGIAVPTQANDKNWENLVELIYLYKPERIVCLGDLFHSHYNSEWESVIQCVRNFESIQFELVLGNHDVLSPLQYTRSNMKLYDELIEGPFRLSHHPPDDTVPADGHYHLAGHIHPGARLVGKGRQAVMLPCFHFGQRGGLLPAFGMFTGLARIHPVKEDAIFVIAENQIIRV